jgi:tetratricopeptide (TPR) repeat protein
MKCPVCGKKAKRACRLRDGTLICPRCCATERSEACVGCPCYTAARQYQQEKAERTGKIDSVIELKPELEDRIDEALILVEKRKFHKAGATLDRLAAEDPDYYMIHYAYGVLAASNNNFDDAIDRFQKVLRQVPSFLPAQFNLAMSYKVKLDIPNMVYWFRRVTRNRGDEEIIGHAKAILQDLEESIIQDFGIDLDAYLAGNAAFAAGMKAIDAQQWETPLTTLDAASISTLKIPKRTATSDSAWLEPVAKRKRSMRWMRRSESIPNTNPPF